MFWPSSGIEQQISFKIRTNCVAVLETSLSKIKLLRTSWTFHPTRSENMILPTITAFWYLWNWKLLYDNQHVQTKKLQNVHICGKFVQSQYTKLRWLFTIKLHISWLNNSFHRQNMLGWLPQLCYPFLKVCSIIPLVTNSIWRIEPSTPSLKILSRYLLSPRLSLCQAA